MAGVVGNTAEDVTGVMTNTLEDVTDLVGNTIKDVGNVVTGIIPKAQVSQEKQATKEGFMNGPPVSRCANYRNNGVSTHYPLNVAESSHVSGFDNNPYRLL